MSYLLDKKIQKKRVYKIALVVVLFVVLFYFKLSIYNGLSYVSQNFFHPVWVVGNSIGGKFKSLGAYFVSKNSLYLQNQKLQAEVEFNNARMANYDSVVADNASIKEVLNRKDPKVPMVLSAILSKPNQSLYDTLVIDAGAKQGLRVGDVVFALGNIPIGRIGQVYDNSSKVILFSNAGERTQVIISGKDIFMEVVGRGGGNFEMTLPRDLTLEEGNQVVMPGINSYVLAITRKIISDPRNSFTKALLVSPVNIQELKFVEVEL